MAMAMAGDRDESAVMDPALWSALQDHIDLKHIYTKLPLDDFFRLRVVCKDWHRAASNDAFLEHAFTSTLRKPYFLISGVHVDTQFTRLLTFTGSEWLVSHAPDHNLSAEGVLYSHSFDENFYAVNHVVFNLHSRVRYNLPPAPHPTDDPFVALRVAPSSFEIVYAGSSIPTQIYNSREKFWTIRTQQHPEMAPGCASCAEASGFLYLRTELDGIVSYDLATGAWNMYMDAPPGDCDDYLRSIGAWDGRLIVVSVTLKERAVTAWALADRDQAKWEPVMRMPEEFYRWITYEDGDADFPVDVDSDAEIRTSFCGEFVLVYTWLREEGLAERFVMGNLERKAWEMVEVPFGSCCALYECEL